MTYECILEQLRRINEYVGSFYGVNTNLSMCLERPYSSIFVIDVPSTGLISLPTASLICMGRSEC